MFFLVLLLALNAGISYWNAYVCGSTWIESRMIGGWGRLVVWCGTIQSAIGFTMVYAIGIALVCEGFGVMPDKFLRDVVDITYLAIIVPVIGTGLVLTIESWRQFIAKPSFAGGSVTAWNTYAQASNTYGAFSGIGSALEDLFKGSDGSDDEDNGWILAVAFFAFAISAGAGVMTTRSLIYKYASTRRLTPRTSAAHAPR